MQREENYNGEVGRMETGSGRRIGKLGVWESWKKSGRETR